MSLTGTKWETVFRGTASDAAMAGAPCASSHSNAARSGGSGSSASAYAATSAENSRAGCGGHSHCRRSLCQVATYLPVRKFTSITRSLMAGIRHSEADSVAATWRLRRINSSSFGAGVSRMSPVSQPIPAFAAFAAASRSV